MKYAVLLDGGFVKPKYKKVFSSRITAQNITFFVNKLSQKYASKHNLLRIYYYDSPPVDNTVKYPISQKQFDLKSTEVYKHQTKLLKELKQSDYLAVREGTLVFHGWVLKNEVLRNLANPNRVNKTLSDNCFKMDIQQKGVDTKFGLDVAWMSFCNIVDRIILVTGDSDFVPAIKAARRNAIQVILCTLAHGVPLYLKNNADVLDERSIYDVMNS